MRQQTSETPAGSAASWSGTDLQPPPCPQIGLVQTFLSTHPMNLLNDARLHWQHAQAELQSALAELEKRVAETAPPEVVLAARKEVERRQKDADHLLARYITQVGKS